MQEAEDEKNDARRTAVRGQLLAHRQQTFVDVVEGVEVVLGHVADPLVLQEGAAGLQEVPADRARGRAAGERRQVDVLGEQALRGPGVRDVAAVEGGTGQQRRLEDGRHAGGDALVLSGPQQRLGRPHQVLRVARAHRDAEAGQAGDDLFLPGIARQGVDRLPQFLRAQDAGREQLQQRQHVVRHEFHLLADLLLRAAQGCGRDVGQVFEHVQRGAHEHPQLRRHRVGRGGVVPQCEQRVPVAGGLQHPQQPRPVFEVGAVGRVGGLREFRQQGADLGEVLAQHTVAGCHEGGADRQDVDHVLPAPEGEVRQVRHQQPDQEFGDGRPGLRLPLGDGFRLAGLPQQDQGLGPVARRVGGPAVRAAGRPVGEVADGEQGAARRP
ncbi:hypothetical protein L1856_28110 [Streptomyces sp. Tue 6430]|nr:hypothetical protein [Streptomyces sp. Tue 6430]